MQKSSAIFTRLAGQVLALASVWLCCAASAAPVAGTATNRPPVNVLLLGYYIWAKPDYVELCKKEGVHIYGPMREDPTGADPAHYSVDFLKQFHVQRRPYKIRVIWRIWSVVVFVISC